MNVFTSARRLAGDRSRMALAAAAGVALAAPAMAQDLRQVQPSPPPPMAAPTAQAAAPVATYGPLRGVAVLSEAAQFKVGGATAEGLDLSRAGVASRPQVRAAMGKALTPFLGKPLSQPLLAQIRTELGVALARAGDRFDRVLVPQQDVTGGTLQILLLRGRLGKVAVVGARWFDESSYRRALTARAGQPLDGAQLDADVDWLNRNPFRHAQLIVKPGGEAGLVDVTLKATDEPPIRLYTSYDNSGTSTTDYDRWNIGLNLGDLAGQGIQTSYQHSEAADFRSLDANSGSVSIALPWRHVLTLSGSEASVISKLPPPLNQTGYSSALGVRYEIPVANFGWLSNQGVSLAFDYKRSNNNLLFAQFPVFGAVTEIGQWTLNYAGTETDKLGSTNLSLSAVYSPGRWLDHDSDAAYAKQRTGAHARYAYVNLQISRTTRLPYDFSLVDSLQVQLSSSNLLGSEELAFGGEAAIRGYDPDQVYADEGVISRNELRAPPVPLLKYAGLPVRDQLQPFVFIDAGEANIHNVLANEASPIYLASSGLGLNYALGKHFSVAFDYGWQLRNPDLGPRPRVSRSDFSAVLSW